MGLFRWFSNSWWSCRKYAQRMSRALDQPLYGWEKAGYLFHHYWCFSCRRFRKQVVRVEERMADLGEKYHSGEIEQLTEKKGLSEERAQKIEALLRSARK